MTKLLLTLGLALGLSLSTNVAQAVELNGFVAAMAYRSDNVLPFDKQELGIGIHHEVNDNLSLYASVHAAPSSTTVSSAFAMFEFPIKDQWELTTTIGRNRNCYCLYNYTRFHPATRDHIILPQSIYWEVLEYLAGYTDGISFKLKTPVDVMLHASFGKVEIKDSVLMNNTVFIPGNMSPDTPVQKLGITYETSNISLGGQQIRCRLQSDLVGEQDVRVDALFARYSAPTFSMSAEVLKQSTSISRMMGAPDALATSLSFKYNLTGKLAWFVNRNEVNYNNPALDYWYVGKARTVDLNTGFRYRIYDRTTLKVEYHRVNGTSWLDPTKNIRPVVNNNILATQLIFEF
jgi:hypothetical protein